MEIVSSKKLAWFALAFTVVAAAGVAVAQNTAQDFVNLHNSPRADVGVGNVTWNATVAAYAQSYANQRAGDCRLVVWRASTAIGCARVVCSNNAGVFIICNYYPPGNVIGQSPY
ncbi:unnamed protein product [Miscanthus lutarioriparius]|uniref:SCP domain-containing protein n=1 Tax=Miscanthus lutarioriparius TaxID=422564 RepID=A0A811NFD6_9POAL|nr:unnamed protein product [Miscanthus lutarioriparius]